MGSYKEYSNVSKYVDSIPIKNKVETVVEDYFSLDEKETFNLSTPYVSNTDAFDPKNFKKEDVSINIFERRFDDKSK